jgi:glycosyltransferase involved in cell wall biosynthesis
MGYLCKYLKRAGWNPSVITEYSTDRTFAFLQGDTDVTYIRLYSTQRPFRRLKRALFIAADLLFDCKNRRMYREALRHTRRQPYQLILCSTFRTYPLPAAIKIARKMHLPLVADLRDIIEQSAGSEFLARPLPKLLGMEKWILWAFKKRSLYRRNRVLRQARSVTTVSPWHVDVLKPYNPAVTLISNGYDPELFYPAPVETAQFCITYTGRLFSTALRDPELLLQAVARLDSEQLISPDTFRIRWYTDPKSRQIICDEAGRHGVSRYMDYPGYIAASDIPTVLNESAILLILTNRAGKTGPNGIMTTKLFEALAVEKPVLCVRGDGGCMEELIRLTRSGLSAHHAEEVFQFIREQYMRWETSGNTSIDANRAEIRKFSREAQANQFIHIFEQIINA